MQTVHPSIPRRRRAVAEPVTVLAMVALGLSALSLGQKGHRGYEAALANREISANIFQVRDGLRDQLQNKYERMRNSGQLTTAEFELATHRLRQDTSDIALQNAADELANKQRILADDAFWDFATSAYLSAVTSGAGELLGPAAGNANTIFKGTKDSSVVAGIFDGFSAFDGALGLASTGSNRHLVNSSDFNAAANRAGDRLQGGDHRTGDTNVLLRQRILAFFDKWCRDNEVLRHREQPNHENWVRQWRTGFEQRCQYDFVTYVREILAAEGWQVSGQDLESRAWQVLTTSRNYLTTFGRDYSGQYSYVTTSQSGQKTTHKMSLQDHRNGTATMTVYLPPNINVSELPLIGLPASNEIRFPLEAQIDRNLSREVSFFTTGKELHTVASALVKFGVRLKEGLSAIFGGSQRDIQVLVDRSFAENCRLSLKPVSIDSPDLDITFRGTFVTASDVGRIVTEKKAQNITVRAQRTR
ncbi:MAG: hypothetical protein RIK87_21365 [Fuerstiella sp.]